MLRHQMSILQLLDKLMSIEVKKLWRNYQTEQDFFKMYVQTGLMLLQSRDLLRMFKDRAQDTIYSMI